MKNHLLILFVSFLAFQFSTAQEVYYLSIDGEEVELRLNETISHKVGRKEVSLQLRAKDTLSYSSELTDFNYFRSNPISEVVLDEGIKQLMMVNAEGTGVILQEYDSFNTTFMNEMMMNEVTKESVNYGFEMQREDYQRTLMSGETLNIQRAVLTYKDEINIYEIATLGNKDSGILIMTMAMDDNQFSQGRKIIELFWSTLQYKQP